MSEHEHEDIARRLRAEGQASAPPDLLPSVMAEVRADSRRRRRLRLPSFPEWRPVAAWATAAAALVALGFGISRLDLHTTSSSSASSASESHAPALAAEGTGSRSPVAPETFTVSRKAAASILGPYLYSDAKQRTVFSSTAGTPLKISVPAAKFGPLSALLRAAERQYNGAATPSNSTAPGSVVVIRLMRAHAP